MLRRLAAAAFRSRAVSPPPSQMIRCNSPPNVPRPRSASPTVGRTLLDRVAATDPRRVAPAFALTALGIAGAHTTGEFSVLTLQILSETPQIWSESGSIHKHIEQLSPQEVRTACIDLFERFASTDDLAAGYHFLHCISLSFHIDLDIPPFEEFTKNSIKEIILSLAETAPEFKRKQLLQIIQLFMSHRQPRTFCALTPPPLYRQILGNEKAAFEDFIKTQLIVIPMEEWREKQEVILNLLYHFTNEEKLALGKELSTSTDPKTAEIGVALVTAMEDVICVPPYFDSTYAKWPKDLTAIKELQEHLSGLKKQHLFYPPGSEGDVSYR